MSDLQSPDDLPPHSIETPSVCVAAKVGAADAVAAVGAPKMGFVAETTAFVKPEKAVVRPAMPADTENVSRVLARSYRALLAEDYEPALLREALPLISRARPSLMSCGTYFVVERGDDIVGAGGWTDLSPHGTPGRRGEGHIRHVATDPRTTRQGIGRALMDRVMRSARSAGITRLHCQSTLTAEPFYAALGFVRRGQIDVRLPTGVLFPAVQMQWQIEAC